VKETLTTIIKSLVTDESAISINEIEGEKTVTYEVRVAEGDMGKVIGKEGRIAKAIRTIMKALAAKDSKKITIEFIG
jgi:predicted RNA-binding protein YlqC (UPF0109 family)